MDNVDWLEFSEGAERKEMPSKSINFVGTFDYMETIGEQYRVAISCPTVVIKPQDRLVVLLHKTRYYYEVVYFDPEAKVWWAEIELNGPFDAIVFWLDPSVSDSEH
jgi:hypothetical protein